VITYSGTPCKVDDCDRDSRSLGFCHKHYNQFRAGMIDEDGRQLRESLKGQHQHNEYRTVQRGYIKLMEKDHPAADRDGYVLEHRLVMERHLGRFLLLDEVVHHINGIRGDNRIENLQLLRGRNDHHPFHERVEEVEQAVTTLEQLVHRGMTGSPEIKKRRQRVARRLR
jgi:hypothetical protein